MSEDIKEPAGAPEGGSPEPENKFEGDKFYKFAKGKGVMNLPNKLTISRMVMIPVFVLLFYLVFPGHYFVSLAVFAIASLTDLFDGKIARKYGLVTNLGKFLDPIADKVLVSTALILLLTRGGVFEISFFSGWGLIVAGICVAVILARELIVSGFRMIAAGRGIVLAADKLGKLKTVFQDASIALILAGMAFIGYEAGVVIAAVGIFCFYICTVLTVVSGVNYVVRNKQVLSEEAQA